MSNRKDMFKMNLLLQDDLDVIGCVVDEARVVSNALYKYVDNLAFLPDQVNPHTGAPLKGQRIFEVEDVNNVMSMTKTISRLCLIVTDSLEKVTEVLCKFQSPDREQLKSVVFDELYRGL